LNHFIVLREGHDGQRLGAEEHQRKPIVRSLRNKLCQQIAGDFCLGLATCKMV